MNSLAKTGLVLGGLAYLFKDQLIGLISGPTNSVQAETKPYKFKVGDLCQTPCPAGTACASVLDGKYNAAGECVASDDVAAVLPPTNAVLPVQPPAPPPPTPAPAIPLEDIVFKIRVYSGQRRLASADEWNWYYTRASGIEQTADLFTPGDRGEQITLSDYLARRASAGLSGLAVIGGRR